MVASGYGIVAMAALGYGGPWLWRAVTANTMCHWTVWTHSVPAKWHLNPSKGLNKVYECDRRQTDRPRCREVCRNRL